MTIFRNDPVDKNVISVAAGTYLLCDPCYCFSHDTTTWDDLLFDLHKLDNESGYIAIAGNVSMTCGGTSHGDGEYRVESSSGCLKGSISVDSGLIGLVPIDFVEKGSTVDTDDFDFGLKLTFDRSFIIAYDKGVFEIITSKEHLIIDTTHQNETYDDIEYEENSGWVDDE